MVVYVTVYRKANTSALGAAHARITLGRKQEQMVNTEHKQKSRIIPIFLPLSLFFPPLFALLWNEYGRSIEEFRERRTTETPSALVFMIRATMRP